MFRDTKQAKKNHFKCKHDAKNGYVSEKRNTSKPQNTQKKNNEKTCDLKTYPV